jgi:hypothetical protein
VRNISILNLDLVAAVVAFYAQHGISIRRRAYA